MVRFCRRYLRNLYVTGVNFGFCRPLLALRATLHQLDFERRFPEARRARVERIK